jgi:hypothetical protein
MHFLSALHLHCTFSSALRQRIAPILVVLSRTGISVKTKVIDDGQN